MENKHILNPHEESNSDHRISGYADALPLSYRDSMENKAIAQFIMRHVSSIVLGLAKSKRFVVMYMYRKNAI